MGFDFEIHFNLGSENRVADALSRVMDFNTISMVTNSNMVELPEEVLGDDQLKAGWCYQISLLEFYFSWRNFMLLLGGTFWGDQNIQEESHGLPLEWHEVGHRQIHY
ncbi:hypothetical protein CR513_33546, partial [Mucuna pruriens]